MAWRLLPKSSLRHNPWPGVASKNNLTASGASSKRAKITTTSLSSGNDKILEAAGCLTTSTTSSKHQLDLSFTDTKEAYKSKKTSELVRALVVLKLCSYDYIVKNHKKLITLGRRLLGATVFRYVVKRTFYAHFVAGENEVEMAPAIARLRSFGVKAIFDYSAEEDVPEEPSEKVNQWNGIGPPTGGTACESAGRRDDALLSGSQQELKQFKPVKDFMDGRRYNVVARTYFYLSEAQCEKNMETFIRSIDAVAGTTDHTGLAAVKLTALGSPKLLMQLSEVIARTRLLFNQDATTDKLVMEHLTPAELQDQLDKRYKIKSDNEEVRKWFERMDYDRRGLMNLYCWNGLIDMQCLVSDLFKVPNLKTGKMENITSALTSEEEEMFRNLMRRIHTIARHARNTDVRIMIDAEQTYLQPAINRITVLLMKKYNKDKAIVFNTYQCYLKEAYNIASIDLELSKRHNFYFGAKLVRGAYIDQERERAKTMGYPDPINPTFEATTEMYHKTLTKMMEQMVATRIDGKTAIMVASHNEDTIRFAVQKMKELGIEPHHKVICFGQLYGMCDQVSFPLGQSGYSVYKYVPYGPVDEVLPYLCRRAAENHGILAKVQKERSLLRKEVLRRLVSGEAFHKPIGHYTPI